jgi:hypothetical protein
MSNNFEKNIQLYIQTFYVRTQSFAKNDIFVASVKTIMIGDKKNIFCPFYTSHRKFPHETLCATTKYPEILRIF